MSWRAIIEADVMSKINDTEVSVYRAAALQSGQADPLTKSITEITEMVRGYIPSLRGATGTVPEELIPSACDIIINSFLNRASAPISESRKNAKDDAFRLLRDCQKGDFRISLPDTVSTETPANPTPYILEPTDTANYNNTQFFGTKFDRTEQDGI